MLESSILDHFEIISENRNYKLPPHVTGTLTLHPDKIDLWINEHPFYEGVFELTKYFNEGNVMFNVEAYTDDGIRVRLEKCAVYRWGQNIWGKAAKHNKPPTITGIGVQCLNVKWFYDNS